MFMEETNHRRKGISSLWKGLACHTRDTGMQCRDVSVNGVDSQNRIHHIKGPKAPKDTASQSVLGCASGTL